MFQPETISKVVVVVQWLIFFFHLKVNLNNLLWDVEYSVSTASRQSLALLFSSDLKLSYSHGVQCKLL